MPGLYDVQYRGETMGPYEESQLRELINNGQLSRYALVRKQGSSQWLAFGDMAELLVYQDANTPVQPPPLPDHQKPEFVEESETPPSASDLSLTNRIPDLPAMPTTCFRGEIPIGVRQRLGKFIKNLPWPVKIVVGMGLLGVFLFGTAGAGFVSAATGGIPVFLSVVFLGVAFMVVGIITTFQAIIRDPYSGAYLGVVMGLIARDLAVRRATDALKKAMAAKPAAPEKQDVPEDEMQLRNSLLKMDPFDFERHVMSFFSDAGMVAWVTRKSNDAGVDGFARHPKGLVVVQCKRNAPGNPVGRPIVQQLKGVVEENQAWCGIIVTTSSFTEEAKGSSSKSERILLVDMDDLILWHQNGLILE